MNWKKTHLKFNEKRYLKFYFSLRLYHFHNIQFDHMCLLDNIELTNYICFYIRRFISGHLHLIVFLQPSFYKKYIHFIKILNDFSIKKREQSNDKFILHTNKV